MHSPTRPYVSYLTTQRSVEIWAKLENNLTGQPLVDHFDDLADAFCRLLSASPFLLAVSEREAEFVAKLFTESSHHVIENLLAETAAAAHIKTHSTPQADTSAALKRCLRLLRRKLALALAVYDVSDHWSLEEVTQTLSRFADLCVEAAFQVHAARHLSKLPAPQLRANNADALDNNDQETQGKPSILDVRACGLFILALGKLGGRELNYSSDIDLIALYDTALWPWPEHHAGPVCVKIIRDIIQTLEQRTEDGYVLRTDFRLRPNPSSTPLALSTQAAETYYHSQALNWERAAMIKARPIAGDIAAAERYLGLLSAWVWRRSVDFTAVKDIIALKDQIERHNEQTAFVFKGYNVKLGPGGIREIEFYTQIHQLLFGGRLPGIRSTQTLDALAKLVAAKRVSPKNAKTLQAAYRLLRTIEHRIQMLDDAQTHTLPLDDGKLRAVALLCGLDIACLEAQTKAASEDVQHLFDLLYPDAGQTETTDYTSLSQITGLLSSYGYSDPSGTASYVEDWMRGKHKALRSDKARLIIQRLLPQLLYAFSETPDPAKTITRFDTFLSGLPAGVQLFSLLEANPSLCGLLARILGQAPALANTLAATPALWDYVLEPDFFEPVYIGSELSQVLDPQLARARDYEDTLNICRRFAREVRFRIGVQIIEACADIRESGAALSYLADGLIERLTVAATAEFESKHGRIAGSGLAVMALGQLGGRSLTFSSDLDLMFLYTPGTGQPSDGARSLMPSAYYSRLVQVIITALTTLTAEGALFEVDTRLRPSGSQGPIVVTTDTFDQYYSQDAWTWEYLALTRLRCVYCSAHIKPALTTSLARLGQHTFASQQTLLDVADMREKLRREFGSHEILDIKHTRGGLVDIEFIVQYGLLAGQSEHGAVLQQPYSATSFICPKLTHAIEQLLLQGFLSEKDASTLSEAAHIQHTVLSVLRLCHSDSKPKTDSLSLGLQEILCKTMDCSTYQQLLDLLNDTQERVRAVYAKIIDKPASNLSQSRQTI